MTFSRQFRPVVFGALAVAGLVAVGLAISATADDNSPAAQNKQSTSCGQCPCQAAATAVAAKACPHCSCATSTQQTCSQDGCGEQQVVISGIPSAWIGVVPTDDQPCDSQCNQAKTCGWTQLVKRLKGDRPMSLSIGLGIRRGVPNLDIQLQAASAADVSATSACTPGQPQAAACNVSGTCDAIVSNVNGPMPQYLRLATCDGTESCQTRAIRFMVCDTPAQSPCCAGCGPCELMADTAGACATGGHCAIVRDVCVQGIAVADGTPNCRFWRSGDGDSEGSSAAAFYMFQLPEGASAATCPCGSTAGCGTWSTSSCNVAAGCSEGCCAQAAGNQQVMVNVPHSFVCAEPGANQVDLLKMEVQQLRHQLQMMTAQLEHERQLTALRLHVAQLEGQLVAYRQNLAHMAANRPMGLPAYNVRPASAAVPMPAVAMPAELPQPPMPVSQPR